ncbi:MAG: DUF2071 domain-containing protein [Verrucomicrobiota bacterium]
MLAYSYCRRKASRASSFLVSFLALLAISLLRPRGLPAVPGLSNFLELNVRTYVHDERGVPGVWFHSLDCNQFLAVRIARSFFHLPYEHASMEASEEPVQSFSARRHGQREKAAFAFSPLGEAVEAEEGTLEYFLLERYVLYSHRPSGSLHEGRVHHVPYRYHRELELQSFSSLPIEWDGLPQPQKREPDHVCLAPGVEVEIFPLKRLR